MALRLERARGNGTAASREEGRRQCEGCQRKDGAAIGGPEKARGGGAAAPGEGSRY
jgi:hypothetical protein